MKNPIARSVAAGLAYFAVVFAAGFVLGTLRVLLVAPALGEFPAVAVELPIMLFLSWLACGRLAKRFEIPLDQPARGVMGGSAFGLLMAAELGVSLFMFGRPLVAHLEHYREVPALLGLTGQMVFAAFPVIQARLQARYQAAGAA